MERIKTSLAAVMILLVCCVSHAADSAFTVIIDPGHGGKDSGCSGVSAKEKDIVLAVGKLLRDKISHKYGDDVTVVMTRDNDRFIELSERARIANDAHGDLFISIHVNSVDRKHRGRTGIQGTSVYTCGLHKSQDNLQVAMRENSVMELETGQSGAYHGFDPQSSESYIMFELSQSSHMLQSINFAKMVEDYLVSCAGRADRGVKQAGFWVLWATAMPSVLVELDFICNPQQESFLSSASGQKRCAEALFKAFNDYYEASGRHKSP